MNWRLIVSALAMLGFTSSVFAADAASTQSGIMAFLPTMLIMLVFGYFIIFRPQQKRQSEHRKLMDSLAKDDEVLTSGGIVGRIDKLSDHFVRLVLADNVEVTLQRAYISKVLPKGTLTSLD
ncbi:MAG: preprotein translocase subunit YajC [Pseudomonadota bacterium]|nr:preprotein translocase subunit YajC [Pseudomonadota bacterium]